MNLRTGEARGPPWDEHSSLSEAGTLSLEWAALDAIAGAPRPALDAAAGLEATGPDCTPLPGNDRSCPVTHSAWLPLNLRCRY